MVRVNDTLLVPAGLDSESYGVYESLRLSVDRQGQKGRGGGIEKIVRVQNSEFTKIDGALTCRSLLRWGFEE